LERARRSPVRAVGPDEDETGHAPPIDLGHNPLAGCGDAGHPRAVPEFGAGSGCLLGEEAVEPSSLRHQDHGLRARALAPPAVAEPELHALHPVLEDGVERERRQARRADGHPAAARLVAGEARAVDEQHRRAAARQAMRAERAGRAGAHDDRVEPFDRPIVDPRAARCARPPAGI